MSTEGRARSIFVVVVAFAGLNTVTSCGDSDSISAGNGDRIPADEVAAHVGTYEAFGEEVSQALLEGTVRIVDGCFLVDDGRTRYLPYFPDDEVQWNGAGLDYDDSSFGDGDDIALGGGESGSKKPIPANCKGLDNLVRWTVAQN